MILQRKFRVLVSESFANIQCVLKRLEAPRRLLTNPPAVQEVELLAALLELLCWGQRPLEDFRSCELRQPLVVRELASCNSVLKYCIKMLKATFLGLLCNVIQVQST